MREKAAHLFSGLQGYYAQLAIVALVGMVVLLLRARLGVDLTDDAWYTSDPYWVAKGSIPYLNNWTQAAGFTLPLFFFHFCFLVITGGNEGIILFSRILFCIWKTLIVSFSFVFLRKSGIRIPAVLALPLIAFQEHQLYAINYNSIGVSYIFLIFSILAISLNADEKVSNRKEMCIGIICGILMGRCIIGTPSTIIVCALIPIILLYNKKLKTLKGFIFGVTIAALSVIGFCCFRGGIKNFVIGIQYFFKDLEYWSGLQKYGVSFLDYSQVACLFLLPSICLISLVFILRNIMKNIMDFFRCIVLLISSTLLIAAIYFLKYYYGVSDSIGMATKFGWFIPLMLMFLQYNDSTNRRIKIISFLSVAYMAVYLLQGYISMYGFVGRAYWNYASIVLSIYCIYICLVEIYKFNDWICHTGTTIACLAIVYFVVRGSYMYVYRDMPCEQLTAKVESGVWRGCFTTQQRAETVVEIEQYMRSRTDENDQVLCWGGWPSFLNLLHNGHLCSASPLGTGQKNGFDFWHMYQVVPSKVFVHADTNDQYGLMSGINNKLNVWEFITLFYTKKDEFNYTSYDEKGDFVNYRIIEYDISNYNEALLYADRMATKVFDFK